MQTFAVFIVLTRSNTLLGSNRKYRSSFFPVLDIEGCRAPVGGGGVVVVIVLFADLGL